MKVPAHLSVLSDSSKLQSAGDTHAIMTVRLLPPRESCSSLVSLLSLRTRAKESRQGSTGAQGAGARATFCRTIPYRIIPHMLSLLAARPSSSCDVALQPATPTQQASAHLYGMCLWLSTMALITLPSDSRPRLMWMPSLRRAPASTEARTASRQYHSGALSGTSWRHGGACGRSAVRLGSSARAPSALPYLPPWCAWRARCPPGPPAHSTKWDDTKRPSSLTVTSANLGRAGGNPWAHVLHP